MGESNLIPAGYRPIAWAEMRVDDSVWLNGVKNGQAHAYGPYIVANVEHRTLRMVGTPGHFKEGKERLLVRDRLTSIEPPSAAIKNYDVTTTQGGLIWDDELYWPQLISALMPWLPDRPIKFDSELDIDLGPLGKPEDED